MEYKSKKEDKSSRKTPVICSRCKLKREKKDTIVCSQCNKIYDFHCIGLSEKLYRLMLPEKKAKLKCRRCTQTSPLMKAMKAATTSNNKEVSNITLRRQIPSTSKEPILETSVTQLRSQDTLMSNSLDLLSDDEESPNKSSTERLSKSVDYTSKDICDIEDLKEQIADLTTSLMTTQNEMENTIIENNDLKRQIDKLNKEVKILMTICQAPAPNLTPNLLSTVTPSRKSKVRRRTSCFTPRSISDSIGTNVTTEFRTDLQSKIWELQEKLLFAEKEIATLHKQIKQLETELYESKINCTDSVYSESNIGMHPSDDDITVRNAPAKQKIVIVGTQQCTGLAAALIKTRSAIV